MKTPSAGCGTWTSWLLDHCSSRRATEPLRRHPSRSWSTTRLSRCGWGSTPSRAEGSYVHGAIEDVRSNLIRLTVRASRDLEPLRSASDHAPEELHAVSGRLTRVARKLIPMAAGVAAASLAEVLTAGTTFGHASFLTYTPVKASVEKLLNAGADKVAGVLATQLDPAEGGDLPAEPAALLLNPWMARRAHASALMDLTEELRDWAVDAQPPEDVLRRIRRHAGRLADLARDGLDEHEATKVGGGTREVIDAAEAAVDAIHRARDDARGSGTSLADIDRAIDEARRTAARLAHALE